MQKILYHGKMKRMLQLIMLILVFNVCFSQQLLLTQNTHLRHGSQREWLTFPEKADDSALSVSFTANNTSGGVISLEQYDVTHVWRVILNGREIGQLTADEQRMTSLFAIPSGLLKKNGNKLTIIPAGNYTQPDDITVGNIILDNRLSFNAKVSVNVTSNKQPIPSRLTIISKKALQPIEATSNDTLAVRKGVLYSGTGNFTFNIPAGTYTIYASRGFEYGVDSFTLVAKPGQNIFKQLKLKHDVDIKQWKSIDTHIHTLEYSGHGDASMKERILTIAGEGLDYAVITEHNKAIDIQKLVSDMHMDKWFTPIVGDELTTTVGHFNIFPMDGDSVPSPENITWKNITAIRKKGNKVVIMNHARDEHTSFRPSDTMFSITPAEYPANAMEVMNSGSQQTDPYQLYLDCLRLMSRGVRLSAVGSSDSHDVSRFIVGQSRTYIPSEGNLVSNFLDGKTAVSFGLFTELVLDSSRGNDKLWMTIKVHSPTWIKPSNVKIYANGEEIYSSSFSDVDKQVGNFYLKEISISKPAQQTTFVAVAEGKDPRAPWWPINRPYQHTSPEFHPIVLGITPVVLYK